jgi:hypothetical protein
VVQRKMAEAGRGLNLSKCRILIHPDAADLVVWPNTLPSSSYPLLPVVSTGMKLLGAPIGPETFRRDFVENRVRKVTASVPCMEKMAPWATWSLLRYCVNECINYLTQVTESPLVQDSLALTSDFNIFRAFYLASGESSPLCDFTNPDHSAGDRKAWRTGIRGAEANIKSEGRKINRLRFDALVQLLHSRGRLSEACWLRSNRFQRSGCWLAGPGGFLANSTSLSWAEYKMSLCIRLLRSPASLDVGDAEGAFCVAATRGWIYTLILCISSTVGVIKGNSFAVMTISVVPCII